MTKGINWKSCLPIESEMAPFLIVIMAALVSASNTVGEMALANVTRLATGDLFSLIGSSCGPTSCMEVSHGTALAAMGGEDTACMCRCHRETPTFREDRRECVDHIDECLMASFGRGATKPQIPFVFLPLKGQIIYPSKEIIFTDVEDAICVVTSAQYLSPSGWVTLRDLIDNDVPFGLYRDEGSTFLQWRGSAALHARLEGRLVAAHVLCSASTSTHLGASCAAFRVAGASQNGLLDVRSIPFHAGEIVTNDSAQSQGLSVLESLAIGVCVLMLIFVYAAGIIFYIHYKQRQKRKQKDAEQNMSSNLSDNGSALESRIDMSNVMLKTNPLLKFNGGSDFFSSDNGLSDVSEHTEYTNDTSPNISQKFQKLNSSVVSAMVHTRRKKPARPSIRSVSNPERFTERMIRRSVSPDAFERAPHSDLSIVDCSVENNTSANRQLMPTNGETALRRKLYFNPVFFETEHLKNPPPAAIDFLIKIREVMSIAKDKMTSKRFIPMLSDIPEEDLHHTIDLGWDIPCARRGRRFSAISLKQENSRKAVHCGGCPGCDSSVRPQKAIALTRSNSCKSCVSDDYKQRIVRKWLDEVHTTSANKKPVKSPTKISGTQKSIESRSKVVRPKSAEPIKHEDPKTNFKESIPNECVSEKCKKENTNKRDAEIEVGPKVISTISKPQEKNKIEENKPNKPTISFPKQISTPITQEKKSPSSHTSRRIRKKLPPPPPPPVIPPEPTKTEDVKPIVSDVKVRMEAVIRELNVCRRVEPVELEEIKMETISSIPPKIIIPVIAADHYFSDDNTLSDTRKKEIYTQRDDIIDFDSLERSVIRRRRFSLACGPELVQKEAFIQEQNSTARERMATSWRDVKEAVEQESQLVPQRFSQLENRSQSISEIFITTSEPMYNNVSTPGPLTIQVRGSPIENRRNTNDDFDPDTLDRKPKRDVKKRVEKILLKSAGSFKYKPTSSESETCKKSPDVAISRKIGNLRQIYEAKAKAQQEEVQLYNRRGSIPHGSHDIPEFMRSVKTPDLIKHIENHKEPKPPVVPKSRRGGDLSPKFSSSKRESPPGERRRMSEERDRFSIYTRLDNMNARRSGRRSARTRSRRTDLRKLYRTEDSGYMSTDSNESKRRASYLMHLRPKTALPETPPVPTIRAVTKAPILQIESDTDDLESLCDGRSESGGESVETDSVFFGNFDDSKEIFAELGLCSFDPQTKVIQTHDQIDSGYMGETNIILSGDSDSEHRSVISIVTDSRPSAGSVAKLDDAPYLHTIEC